MQQGVDIIAQGSLAAGNWFGRPDILGKSFEPQPLGKLVLRSLRLQTRARNQGRHHPAVGPVFRAAGRRPVTHARIHVRGSRRPQFRTRALSLCRIFRLLPLRKGPSRKGLRQRPHRTHLSRAVRALRNLPLVSPNALRDAAPTIIFLSSPESPRFSAISWWIGRPAPWPNSPSCPFL